MNYTNKLLLYTILMTASVFGATAAPLFLHRFEIIHSVSSDTLVFPLIVLLVWVAIMARLAKNNDPKGRKHSK
jgi:hypothetical protein